MMQSILNYGRYLPLIAFCVLLPLQTLHAQANSADDQSPTEQLAARQRRLAEKYQEIELLMLKMAEFDAAENPRRAALLKDALGRSKQALVHLRMAELAELLTDQKFNQAIDGQEYVRSQMKQLLDLLLSEDRAGRLRDQQDRIRQYIRDVDRILRLQRGIQGRTEGGDDTQRLGKEQQQIAQRTDELNRQIKENEGLEGDQPSENDSGGRQNDEAESPEQNTPNDDSSETDDTPTPDSEKNQDSQSGDSQQGQQQQGQQQQGQQQQGQQQQGQQQQGQQQQGQQQQGQQQQGQQQQGQQQQGQQQQGQQQQGQQQQGQQQPPEGQEAFPGQQQLQQAEQRMREAQQRLEDAEREGAIEQQQEARRLLEQAKAELEEILRQLREEEVQRTLTLLEARFRKMLEMQLQVHAATEKLDETEIRDAEFDIRAGKLSVQQGQIVGEADKALLLLREEGSSAAFPEAISQVRDDMSEVASRLGQSKVDRLTLRLEEEIIAALEELVAALQKAQEDAEQRQQNAQNMQQQGSREQALVDKIAELKMIRTLQVRVNKRTNFYAEMLQDPDHAVGQATEIDALDGLSRLANREKRIQEITRDILLKRTE